MTVFTVSKGSRTPPLPLLGHGRAKTGDVDDGLGPVEGANRVERAQVETANFIRRKR